MLETNEIIKESNFFIKSDWGDERQMCRRTLKELFQNDNFLNIGRRRGWRILIIFKINDERKIKFKRMSEWQVFSN